MKAKKAKSHAVTLKTSAIADKPGQKLLEWLEAMPKELTTHRELVTPPVNLTTDVGAWMSYSRVAKARGNALEKELSLALHNNDCAYEEELERGAKEGTGTG